MFHQSKYFAAYTQWTECGIFIIKCGGTYGKHWALEGEPYHIQEWFIPM
jgi:hypothetical protein